MYSESGFKFKYKLYKVPMGTLHEKRHISKTAANFDKQKKTPRAYVLTNLHTDFGKDPTSGSTISRWGKFGEIFSRKNRIFRKRVGIFGNKKKPIRDIVPPNLHTKFGSDLISGSLKILRGNFFDFSSRSSRVRVARGA